MASLASAVILGAGQSGLLTFKLPPLCWRNPATRRSASSAENPHMPRPPRPPALLTAAARAGVLSQPIGACRMGHLRLSLSVNAFLDHMAFLQVTGSVHPVRLPVEL